MAKTVDLDKQLDEAPLAEDRYPMVRDTPEGWPPLKGTVGNTWYQRALNYEREHGEPVRPLVELDAERGKNGL